MEARIIAIANEKGGVGKTSTAVHLADALRHKGKKVLLWDLDPQCNSTSTYKAKTKGHTTSYDIYEKNGDVLEAIQHTYMGDIIPNDEALKDEQDVILKKPGGQLKIMNKIQKLKPMYDFIILDTPPQLGLYLTSALLAATEVIVPIECSRYSIDGAKQIFKTIEEAREVNSDLKMDGLLVTKFRSGVKTHEDTFRDLPELSKKYGYSIIPTPIRLNQKVEDAQSYRFSLYEKFPKCHGAEDYDMLAEYILKGVKKAWPKTKT